jgi:EmrB/QacA subfamily drug resistance transporter
MAVAPPRLSTAGLGVLCATVLVSVTSASMATVALPDLQADFGVSDDELTWVVTAYIITFATGTVGYGRLSDMYGTKQLYLFGLGLFTVAAALVALAPGYWWLVAARALQGFGGTAIPALSMATIVRTTAPAQRGAAMGLIMVAVGVGFGVGPLLGGVLTEWWGWEGVFWGTAVASMALFVGAIWLVPAIPGAAGQTFDYVGALLVSGAITALVIALNRLPRDEADTAGLVALVALAPLLALLAWRIAVARDPYLNPEVIRNGRFMSLSAIGFGAQGAHFATVVLLPLLLARYHGLSTIEIGLLLLPGACALALTGMVGGVLTSRFGNRALIVPGALIMLSGVLILHLAGAGWEPVALSALYFIVAAGYGLLNGPIMNAATSELRSDLTGMGVGVYNLLFFLGGAVCVALAGAILRRREGAGEPLDPIFSGSAPEFSDAFIVVVASAALAFVLAVTLRARPATAPVTEPADVELAVEADWQLKPRAKPNVGR